MTPYILVLTVLGGLGTSASPTILRFPSAGSCVVTGQDIANTIKEQASKAGATISPNVEFNCIPDGSKYAR